MLYDLFVRKKVPWKKFKTTHIAIFHVSINFCGYETQQGMHKNFNISTSAQYYDFSLLIFAISMGLN